MIEGRIIRIFSDEEVLLNVGKTDGVEEGIEFVVYSQGEPVVDPITGEDLGPLETVKGRVKVTHVMPKMSGASTLTYRITTSPMDQMTAPGWRQWTEIRTRKLSVSEDMIEPVCEDEQVKIGDRVRSVWPSSLG